ncbi:MAG TPA: hypothetical protein VFT40_00835, partial [Sphingomicrobium sp.]|nr:hypothetical protein [Sphingomicrobium sp.]
GAFGSAQESLRSGQALEVQASALDRAPSTIPSAGNGPPPRPGEELVGRPDGKLVKASEARWGKAAEEAFLVELTVSGSVRLAAKAAGFSTQALYKQRIKDRRFAAAWDAAIETGKARVQAYLVEAATRTFDPDELPIAGEHDIPKVTIGEAINIAKLPVRAGGAAGGYVRGGKGFEDRIYDETGFDVTPISREEWEEAKERVFNRLERIRERDEREERETGLCLSCGQPLPGGAMPAAGE